jgi:hypothetical protein
MVCRAFFCTRNPPPCPHVFSTLISSPFLAHQSLPNFIPLTSPFPHPLSCNPLPSPPYQIPNPTPPLPTHSCHNSPPPNSPSLTPSPYRQTNSAQPPPSKRYKSATSAPGTPTPRGTSGSPTSCATPTVRISGTRRCCSTWGLGWVRVGNGCG